MADGPTGVSTAPAWPPRRQWIVLGTVVAAVVAVLVVLRLIAWSRPVPPPVPAPPPGVLQVTPDQYAGLKIVTVGTGGVAPAALASGTIAVDDFHSTPVLPPFSGQVTQVLVQPGQRVAQGQPLLVIRAPEFVDGRNALLAATAQRATAAAQLKVATAAATRAEAVYRTAGGALKDYESAQNDLAAAQAGLRTADAAVAAAEGKLSVLGKSPAEVAQLATGRAIGTADPQVTVRAPIAGVVASRSVAVGQYLASGAAAPVFVITDPASVWLVAQVPESASDQVHVGDAATVTTPALPGRTFAARVDNVAAGLDPVSHRLPVRATIRNPDGALKPAMSASFVIRGRSGGGGISVPAAAVIHEGDTARVWVAGANRMLRARAVTLGAAEGGRVAVTSGLAPGDRVVTAGAIFVNEAGSPG